MWRVFVMWKINVSKKCSEDLQLQILANISYKTIAYFLQHGRLFRSDIDISFSSCSCSLPTNSFGVFSQRKVHFSTVPAVCAKLFLLHDLGLFASKSMEFISIAINYFLWQRYCTLSKVFYLELICSNPKVFSSRKMCTNLKQKSE